MASLYFYRRTWDNSRVQTLVPGFKRDLKAVVFNVGPSTEGNSGQRLSTHPLSALTLLLPVLTMESCQVVLLRLWTNSFCVTIQTKPFSSTFTMLGSVFRLLQNKLWKICRFFFLGVKVLRWLTDFVFTFPSPLPPPPTDAITLFRSKKM